MEILHLTKKPRLLAEQGIIMLVFYVLVGWHYSLISNFIYG